MTGNELRASRQMPTPRYFDIQRAPQRVEKMVGVETESIQGGLKTFLYWRRIGGDLSIPMGVETVADMVTELALRFRHDIAVGPAVLLSQCDPDTGHIEIDPNSRAIGIYVEESRRDMAGMISLLLSST